MKIKYANKIDSVYFEGDAVRLELNDGSVIDDKIKAIEPASFVSERARLSPLMLAVSKLFFEKNPDLPYALGAFRDFSRMRLSIEGENLALTIRGAA